MIPLSAQAKERLAAAKIDVQLLAALTEEGALRQVNDHAFAIACGNDGTEGHTYTVDGDPQPLDADQDPAPWFPLGRDGSVAIVVIGAEAGLALASLLFGVAEDGEIHRKANLPGVLADAVPVVLPETYPEIAVEFIRDDDGATRLIAELTLEDGADFNLAFLVLVAETPGELPFAELPVRAFIDGCAAAGEAVGLTVAPVLLPSGVTLGDAIDAFAGHGRRYALAGILEFWRQVALHPPEPDDEEPA